MKKILALVLASLMLISLVACNKNKEEDNNDAKNTEPVADELVFENFKYQVNEAGMYEIIGYIPTSTDLVTVTVPASIEGRPVTGIGESAFKASQYLQGIVLPASITYVADYAFWGCQYLTSVTLPDSIVTLGKAAFQDCMALTTVNFSAELTTIGEYAFMNCTALTAVTLPAKLVNIGAGAFYNCDSLTAIAIPETVRTLGDGAFHECSNLATITVPGTIPATITVTDENGKDATHNVFGSSLFSKCAAELTIVTPADSAFDKYAVENQYDYTRVDPTPAA